MNIAKETKWHLLRCCHENRFDADPVLIKTEITDEFLSWRRTSTPTNLMKRVKTIWEPCLFQAEPSVPPTRVEDVDIWSLTERDWSQECFLDKDTAGVFLLWCTVLVPSVKNTAAIFPYFPSFHRHFKTRKSYRKWGEVAEHSFEVCWLRNWAHGTNSIHSPLR